MGYRNVRNGSRVIQNRLDLLYEIIDIATKKKSKVLDDLKL